MKQFYSVRNIIKALIFLLMGLWACPPTDAAQTISTFDVLVATETLTVVGTTTMQGSAFSVGGTTMVAANGTVSIGTAAPSALFSINSGAASNNAVFFRSSFTAAGISSFTVPAGVYSLFVKAWGAGGGGGGMNNCNANHAGDGAGGSFASGIVAVTPGEILKVLVGAGGPGQGPGIGLAVGLNGGAGLSAAAGGSGGKGGNCGAPNPDAAKVGSGGGGAASGLFRVTTSTTGLVVAGGGGSGGGFTPSSGVNGGSASAIGSGGAGTADGATGSDGIGGGAGGGGATSGGLGGSSGLGGGTGDSIGSTVIYGSGTVAGNTSDADYNSISPSTGYPNGNETVGVGTGGQGGKTSCYGESGNRGAVFLYNATYQSAALDVSYSTSPLLKVFNNGFVGIGTNSPQSTLDVNGTVRLNAIQWPDGTMSTTGSGYVEVSSVTVSAATSYTFGSSVVSSSAVYRLEYNYIQNTSNAYPEITLNGVTSGYRWSAKTNSDNTDQTQTVSTSDSVIRLGDGSPQVAGQGGEGEAIITQTYPAGRVHVRWAGSYVQSTPIAGELQGHGTLEPAVGLNAIRFQVSAGTFTGTLKLYRRWDK